MEISVTIPIQHYLKKYLAKTLDVSPLQMHNRCHVTALLLEPLKKGFIPSKEELSVKFDDFLTCVMNTSILRENKFHIDKDVVLRIDTLLSDKFNEDCFCFIDQQRSKDPNWHDQTSILEFMEYYELQDEDIQFDTIKKRYYRHRQKMLGLPKPKTKPTTEELAAQLTFRFPDAGKLPSGPSINELIAERAKDI
jgi:hypothetical protein